MRISLRQMFVVPFLFLPLGVSQLAEDHGIFHWNDLIVPLLVVPVFVLLWHWASLEIRTFRRATTLGLVAGVLVFISWYFGEISQLLDWYFFVPDNSSYTTPPITKRLSNLFDHGFYLLGPFAWYTTYGVLWAILTKIGCVQRVESAAQDVRQRSV